MLTPRRAHEIFALVEIDGFGVGVKFLLLLVPTVEVLLHTRVENSMRVRKCTLRCSATLLGFGACSLWDLALEDCGLFDWPTRGFSDGYQRDG
jgi:hypothetical protein